MPELDIVKTQRELAKIDSEIDLLQAKKQEMSRDYRQFLRNELAAIDGVAPTRRARGSVKVDDEAIIAHLRRAQIEQSASDIKDAITYDGPGNTLSVALKRLTDENRIVAEGERRGKKYRIV